MRKTLGIGLTVLGTFLVVVGLISMTWAVDAVKKTPLDVNTTTVLEGQGGKLDAETGEVADRPVQAISVTRSDAERSTDEVAVFTTFSCVNYDEGQEPQCLRGENEDRLITVSEDIFATDRETGLAVDTELEPVDHEGLVNKWPFDAEQRTYPYWNGTVGEAVDAVFDRTETINGLETYVYVVDIQDAPIEIAEGTPGTLTERREIAVDPRTGSIINQSAVQQRALENGDLVLDLQLDYTDEQVESTVADAEENISRLDLLGTTVPLVGLLLGIPMVLGGLWLLLRGRRGRASTGGGRHVPSQREATGDEKSDQRISIL